MKITDDMLTELLPCPFCGSRHIEIRADAYAHCHACFSDGPLMTNGAEAAAAWNRRTTPDREAIIEECAKVCDAAASRRWYAEDKASEGCDFCAEEIRILKAAPSSSPWISVDERLPEQGETVAFVVHADDWLPNGHLNGRILGGTFMKISGHPVFNVPGAGYWASYWMPLPAAPNGGKGD